MQKEKYQALVARWRANARAYQDTATSCCAKNQDTLAFKYLSSAGALLQAADDLEKTLASEPAIVPFNEGKQALQPATDSVSSKP